MAHPILDLDLSKRARKACARVGVETIGDFLDTNRSDFLALRNFSVDKLISITERVQTFLDATTPQATPDDASAADAVHVGDTDTEASTAAILQRPRVDLMHNTHAADSLRALDTVTLDDLAWAPHGLLGQARHDGRASIDDPVDDLVGAGMGRGSGADIRTFSELIARLTADLDVDPQRLLRQRIGIARPSMTVYQLAESNGVTADQMIQELHNLRSVLRSRAGGLVEHLRVEGHKELDAWDGFVTSGRLAAGSLLRSAAEESGDPMLPLRLLCFFFPKEFHLCGEALTRSPTNAVRELRTMLRQFTRPALLPVSISALRQQLAELGLKAERGVVAHLVNRIPRLRVFIHPEHGEVVDRAADPIADRIYAIVARARTPILLDDLASEYRNHHGICRRGRLLARLRNDSRFMQIGRRLWVLVTSYRDQLDNHAAEARRIARHIHQHGRHNVRDLADGSPPPERAVYLLSALLRRDPTIRDLGAGDFCSRVAKSSATMARLEADLKMAMGEVPLGLFIDNQPPDRRRLVARLLHLNRRFVYPSDNRVDLLRNYPLTRKRVSELIRVVHGCLDRCGNHATLLAANRAVLDSPLGDYYMNPALLKDLLRRHGDFDLLPGGIVARAAPGLDAWIRSTARAALAAAELPLSADELVAAAPNLEPLRAYLDQLLSDDPAVAREGDRYSIAQPA